MPAPSHQLALAGATAPQAAAVLNCTPEQLDLHGSLARQAAAMCKVFSRMGPSQVAAIPAGGLPAWHVASLLAAALSVILPTACMAPTTCSSQAGLSPSLGMRMIVLGGSTRSLRSAGKSALSSMKRLVPVQGRTWWLPWQPAAVALGAERGWAASQGCA